MKGYYHATSREAAAKIFKTGYLKPSVDGVVYLAESLEDAIKFKSLALMNQPIVVFLLEGLDERKISEQFDHSFEFFQARSFGYRGEIDIFHTASETYVYNPNKEKLK